MALKSIASGSVVTALLIVVLSSSRLFQTSQDVKDVVLTEVETVYLDPPPEPEVEPMEEEVQEVVEMMEQETETLALDLLESDMDMPALPVTLGEYDPTLANVSMVLSAPDKMPTKIPSAKSLSSKGFYGANDLDDLPRVLKNGDFSWPWRAKGPKGSVHMIIEIDEKGFVRVVKVLASTDSKLTAAAVRVANESRFTPPMKDGIAVRARFTNRYNLQKPR